MRNPHRNPLLIPLMLLNLQIQWWQVMLRPLSNSRRN